jgi:hypothetical protein
MPCRKFYDLHFDHAFEFPAVECDLSLHRHRDRMVSVSQLCGVVFKNTGGRQAHLDRVLASVPFGV